MSSQFTYSRHYLFAILFVLFVFPSSALAQRRGFGPGNQLERMDKQLSLSDEQESQLQEIFQSSKGACRDATDRRSCMQENQSQMQEQISNVLTEEQKEKWELSRDSGENRRGRRNKFREGAY